MSTTATLIYDTLTSLSSGQPEEYAEIRQNLYNHLDLSFDKQLALYSNVLGPVSSGKVTDFDSAVIDAYKIMELSE
ncbi:PAS factor family protein [Vibrio makurazakiensis]|uniref:PAS factor family protein n=1 Tax=Vibrio makurazakiensis TaxID=2910250 RepID=UPI003D1521D2